MRRYVLFALGMMLLGFAGSAVLAAPAGNNRVILMFNGTPVGGVASDTKNKDFRPAFEKELVRLSAELPGKPQLKITHWYTIINGGAVEAVNAPADAARQLLDLLKKQPYVKTVELDQKVSAFGAGPAA